MDHDQHQHRHHDPTSAPNRLALSATLHCLAGCSIGEALGLMIASTLQWGNVASIALATVLAFLSGYALTLWPLLSAGMEFTEAVGIAFAADTVSIAVMELVDNAVMLTIPGAMQATVRDPLFWASLGASLVAAFLAAFPVNRWLIAAGHGHAAHHGHH
jgi:hypothetical protein